VSADYDKLLTLLQGLELREAVAHTLRQVLGRPLEPAEEDKLWSLPEEDVIRLAEAAGILQKSSQVTSGHVRGSLGS
jgi:hypothetical protein